MRALPVLLALIAAACGSSDASQKLCGDADYGTGRIQYTERKGGSCGPLADRTAVDSPLVLPAPPDGITVVTCETKTVDHEKECDEKAHLGCTYSDGSTAQASSEISVDESGRPTGGFVEVRTASADGAPTCTSTYDLAFGR